jgi:hypothetical protein
VQELARTYRRRRRGAQAAGGAVLSAGLIAGVINLPGLLPGRPNDTVTMVAPAAAPTSSTPPSDAELQKDWDAYFAAGYGYADAVKLAQIWNSTAEVGMVKAEAGRRLLAGETLPIQPGPEVPSSGGAVDPKADAELRAYFAAGYDYNNAVQLAKIWKTADPYQAKIEGGKKLLAGETLPVKPSPQNVQAAKEGAQIEAFFAAGYTYDDALKLAKLWKTADAYHAKVEGGKKLLAGETLPIRP